MMERSYMNFDKYQQKVIVTNHNAIVIAGPGSGKTTTILNKVKYILEHNPEAKILLLSFTNKSVDDIKNRLSKTDIDILTFHKLAIDILKTYNYKYSIVNEDTLPYIIDEYFLSMDKKDINKLCLYLNIDKFIKTSREYQSLKKLIITFINLFKTNNHNIDNLKKLVNNYKDKYLLKIILDILNIYENEKRSTGTLDFDDLITISTLLLKTDYRYKKYDYIIIDEFQDTSQIRLNLIKAIYYASNGIITVVGDDAQSIYHFSGCDIDLFLNFQSHFPDVELFYLKNTYRNCKKIVDVTQKFIERNPLQLKKNMISNIEVNNPIKIIYYLNPVKALKKILDTFKTEDDVMILSRNHNDINNYIDDEFLLKENSLIYKDKHFKYMTIHSSKGLENDYVIILNNNDSIYGLPNKIEDHPILNYLNKSICEIPYAEERRLFFVALTRCKTKVFLLASKKNPSLFIKELKKLL